MACGWLTVGERAAKPEGAWRIGPGEWQHPVCPGWALTSPVVAEGWRAYHACRAGVLPMIIPRAPHALLEAVLICQRAQNQWESEKARANGA